MLTTNYDTLIDSRDGRSTSDLRDVRDLLDIVTGNSRAVGHLHGVWSRPETVVLGAIDYERYLQKDSHREVEHAALLTRSFVYVGFGSGIEDPHFGNLLAWHRTTFPPLGHTHYRLCLDSELDELSRTHASDNIVPVSYGSSYSDLPGFLELHIPREVATTASGLVRDSVAEAQSAVELELLRSSVIAEAHDENARSVEQAVLAPRLLPVPHPEYVRAHRRANGEPKHVQLDPRDELMRHELLVIVCDEGSGLSTTLRWMLLEATRALPGAFPVFMNFHDSRGRRDPIREEMVRQALIYGIIDRPDGTLPPMVLAVDDFRPGLGSRSRRALESVRATSPVIALMGCRQGEEQQVVAELRAAGLSPVVRYVGRLGRDDIKEIARRMSPARFEGVATQAIALIQSENLPRTPFTVSLLLSVISQAHSRVAVTSQTSILDQYVALILGRGAVDDDPRYTMDYADRAEVLARFAGHLAMTNLATTDEGTTITQFQQTFKELGWTESAGELLKWFIERRVLARKGQEIGFSRSSYLYLFAAKRMEHDKALAQKMLADPLDYANVIVDHSALVRKDEISLSRVLDTLPEANDTAGHRASALEPMAMARGVAPERTSADNGGHTPPTAPTPDASAESPETSGGQITKPDPFDIHFMDEEERPAFSKTPTHNVDRITLLARALDLCSKVLRDSDQIQDQELKRDSLAQVLNSWGTFVVEMGQDESFRRLIQDIADEIAASEAADEFDARKPEFIDRVTRMVPVTIGMAGVRMTLATRKLISALRAIVVDRASHDEKTLTAAALMVVEMRYAGWIDDARDLIEALGNSWIVREFFLRILNDRYVRGDNDEAEDVDLLRTCTMIDAATRTHESAAAKHRYEVAVTQNLRDRRLAYATQRRANERVQVSDGTGESQPNATVIEVL
ncbi:MAG: SIR2 family protein [Demequina sp.]|uniref:SIR2 family protein n=1 Tax=Demequina sp. TaxID=2050685 RepID=UPI003A8A6B9C